MAINLIHVSDIHFGSGESHGRINPQTGLNIRFEDFLAALCKCVDYALEKKADVFLFSGDAYKNASPEPMYQKAFASQLKRLSDADIKTILVVGNHDQLLKATQSHSLSVFQSLEVPGLLTVDKPVACTVNTKSGALQLIGIPHVLRHQLVTLEKYRDLGAAEIDRLLVSHLRELLNSYYLDLDVTIPTVVTAHMALDSAVAGIEEELLVGYTLTFPSDLFLNDRIDYVALGHIHKHQVLREVNPAIVYAGSLERVDFGEEREDKGFVHVTLERGHTAFKFVSIAPRPFITVDVDLTEQGNPSAFLLSAVEAALLPGCVMRVRYKIKQEQLLDLREDLVRNLAKETLSLRFIPDIIPSHTRARMPQLTEALAQTPLLALETYLSEVAGERKDKLMAKVKEIVAKVQAGKADSDA